MPWFMWLIVAAVVAAAVFPLPYGYYILTRIVVCGFCALIAYLSWVNKPPAHVWACLFGLTAILFNPLIPIHLYRATWFWIDLVAAALILVHLWLIRLRAT